MKVPLRCALCLLGGCLLALCGCSQGQPDATLGSLVLSFGSESLAARTLLPSLSMEIASYDVQGTGPEGKTFGGTGLTGASSEWNDLAAGPWTVTVDARNADGILIATDTELATVEAGSTTEIVLTVAPLGGPGSLEIAISWPALLLPEPAVTATLTAEDGTSWALDPTVGSESAACAAGELGSGYYSLTVQLRDGGRLAWGRTEAVRILAGQTTLATFALAAADLNGSPQGGLALMIESDLRAPFEISLSGIVATLPLHTDMTVSAVVEPAPDWWQWFLNGQPLAGAGSSSVTLGGELSPGNYWLDVLARRGSVLSSGHAFFAVSDRPPVGAPAVGEIIINEIMIDPAGVADTSGEWIELYNVTSRPLDIQGLVLRTATQYAGIQASATGLILEPGAYFVLCRNGDPAANGQVTASGVYGSGVSLPNSGGSLSLAEPGSNGMDGVVIDAIQWTAATAGRSLSLKASGRNAADNDVAANWYWSSRPYSASDMGTPGAANEQ